MLCAEKEFAMPTKSELLRLLESAHGNLINGEELAAQLGVSRTAVWKAAQALRREGYDITAINGGGYRLAPGSDLLSAEGIATALSAPLPAVRVFAEVDSTNLEGKRWAMQDAPHGALIAATSQTQGRGRLGRQFASPPGGIYVSLVLRPQIAPAQAVLVTAQAAVATCRAVAELCGLQLQIKWVNDLFLNNRKCCGILSEAATDFETGTLDYIVVGIGINYTTPTSAFAPELQPVATSLFPQGGAPVSRNRLVAAIYTNLMQLFATLPNQDFMQEYKARSLILGKAVTVMASPPYKATAIDIDNEAHLLVRTESGAQHLLSSGEVSIIL